MKVRRAGIVWITCSMALTMLAGSLPAPASEWEGRFTVSVAYQELSGKDEGSADVTLIMVLPAGTPLLGRENAVKSALAGLRDLWSIESVHEEVLGFLGPQIPMDVQRVVAKVEGSGFVMAVIQAFDDVENAGYSRLQSDLAVSATERIQLAPAAAMSARGEYPDAPRQFQWVIGGTPGSRGDDNWVIASLINYSAAVLSFRSEMGRFPRSFAELKESGHVFIEPLNPYTGEPVREVADNSPGNFTYQFIDDNRVVLYTFIKFGDTVDVVRREINLYPTESFDLLYRTEAGLSDDEKTVARYVFQISMILNEYFTERGELPYSIPQCEAEGFAYVSLPNPYTGRDAQQADSLAAPTPGDFAYHRISSTAYFLVGYGEGGRTILSISRAFGTAEPLRVPLSIQHR
jgi:hypothetical protein